MKLPTQLPDLLAELGHHVVEMLDLIFETMEAMKERLSLPSLLSLPSFLPVLTENVRREIGDRLGAIGLTARREEARGQAKGFDLVPPRRGMLTGLTRFRVVPPLHGNLEAVECPLQELRRTSPPGLR